MEERRTFSSFFSGWVGYEDLSESLSCRVKGVTIESGVLRLNQLIYCLLIQTVGLSNELAGIDETSFL